MGIGSPLGNTIGIYIGSKLGTSSNPYGPELMTDGNFTLNNGSYANSVSGTSHVILGGICTITTDAGGKGAYQVIQTESGKTYYVMFKSQSGTTRALRVNDGIVPAAAIHDEPATGGDDSFTFVAASVNTTIYMRHGVAGISEWNYISVREVL